MDDEPGPVVSGVADSMEPLHGDGQGDEAGDGQGGVVQGVEDGQQRCNVGKLRRKMPNFLSGHRKEPRPFLLK